MGRDTDPVHPGIISPARALGAHGWQPKPEDASMARLDEHGNATVWIDAGLHGRLRIAARERGMSIKALAEQALRDVL